MDKLENSVLGALRRRHHSFNELSTSSAGREKNVFNFFIVLRVRPRDGHLAERRRTNTHALRRRQRRVCGGSSLRKPVKKQFTHLPKKPAPQTFSALGHEPFPVTHTKPRTRQLQPVRLLSSSTLDACPHSKLTEDFHARQDLLSNARASSSLVEKKATLSVFLHASFPGPATL